MISPGRQGWTERANLLRTLAENPECVVDGHGDRRCRSHPRCPIPRRRDSRGIAETRRPRRASVPCRRSAMETVAPASTPIASPHAILGSESYLHVIAGRRVCRHGILMRSARTRSASVTAASTTKLVSVISAVAAAWRTSSSGPDATRKTQRLAFGIRSLCTRPLVLADRGRASS